MMTCTKTVETATLPRKIRQTSPQDRTLGGRNLLLYEELIIVREGALMRKNCEDGTATHHQLLIPKHLVTELLKMLHRKMTKHPEKP